MTSAHAHLEQIEQLTHEKSSEKRRQLLNAVTDLFLVTLDNQRDADVSLFGDVMDRIAYELEIKARIELSQRLCALGKAPRRLITKLANDEIAVAQPVLEESTLLEDSDLIEIIANRSQDHLYSIAGRQKVSQEVSGAIVNQGSDHVVTRLTGNHGARFSPDSLKRIAARACDDNGLLSALGSRGDLPDSMMDRIKNTVAERIKAEMPADNDDIDIDFIDTMVGDCAEEVDLGESQKSIDEIERLHQIGELNEGMIAKFARNGRLPDAVHCLALLTGIDTQSAARCVLKAELPALAVLCKANQFKNTTYLALAESRLAAGTLQSSVLAKAMRDYDKMKMKTAERIMRFLKVRLKLQQAKPDAAAVGVF